MSALSRRWAAFVILPVLLALGWISTAGLLACAGAVVPAASCQPEQVERTRAPATTSPDRCQLAPASDPWNPPEPTPVASRPRGGHPIVALDRRWASATPESFAQAKTRLVVRPPSLPVFLSQRSLLL